MEFRHFLSCALVALCVAADEDIGVTFPGVSEMTPSNFEKKIQNGKHWLVEFYLPHCGWCKRLAPEWKIIGEQVGDKHPQLSVGKFDSTDDDALEICNTYGVKGYPTVILIRADGTFSRYSGKRTAQKILDWLEAETGIKIVIQVPEHERLEGGTGAVQKLNSGNIDQLVQDKTKDVMVKFFAPWCGHCKSMEEDWKEFAAKYKGVTDVIIAEADADTYRDIGTKYGVGSFPSIKLFSKTNKQGLEYQGPRTAQAFDSFLKSKRR